MAQRTSHRDSGCTLARPLDAIGDWWSLLIVRDAFDGLSRFGEFQQSLGVAKNILAARLRNLVEHGIFERAPEGGGARAAYLLTDKGRALFPVLVALRQWGDAYCFAPEEERPGAGPTAASHGAPRARRSPACRRGHDARRAPRRLGARVSRAWRRFRPCRRWGSPPGSCCAPHAGNSGPATAARRL